MLVVAVVNILTVLGAPEKMTSIVYFFIFAISKYLRENFLFVTKNTTVSPCYLQLKYTWNYIFHRTYVNFVVFSQTFLVSIFTA